MKKPVLIASDHAGVALKKELQFLLEGVVWEDLGPLASEPSVDYPEYAEQLCQAIVSGKADLGILICGSGIGMAIAANKIDGIRATTAENPVAARLAREHNHVNVLCLGARFVAPHYAKEIAQAFFNAAPSRDERHFRRVRRLGRYLGSSSEDSSC